MSSFYQMLERDVDNQIINIKDFAKYHRYVYIQTDSVLVDKVKHLKNDRYDFFEKNILQSHSDNGKIKTKDAALLWIVYEDSYEVLSAYKNRSNLRFVDPKIAQFWINEFQKPIDELFKYGSNVISSALGIVIDYYREWIVEQKYNRIYSKSEKFDDWIELAKKNQTLLNGEDVPPFDIMDIRTKAQSIIQARH